MSPMPKNAMKKALPLLAVLLLAGTMTFAATPERYLARARHQPDHARKCSRQPPAFARRKDYPRH